MKFKSLIVPLVAALVLFAGLMAGCHTAKPVSVQAVDVIQGHDQTGGPHHSAFNPAFGGVYTATLIGADGQVKYHGVMHNTVTTAGKNHALETEFRGGTAVTTWYIGLISSSSFTAIAAGDTLSSHSGWTEGTPYSGNRPAWTPGAASSGSITNGTSVDITINATLTVKGIFLASANTGTTGTLMSAALFSGGDVSVVSGDTLRITYTFSISLLDIHGGFNPFLSPVRLMASDFIHEERYSTVG